MMLVWLLMLRLMEGIDDMQMATMALLRRCADTSSC